MAPTVVTHDVEAVGYVVVAVWIYETVDFPAKIVVTLSRSVRLVSLCGLCICVRK